MTSRAEDTVTDLCRDLLRIDTSNPTSTERAAAEYVADTLTDAGLDPVIHESEPGRASVVARITGADQSRPALLLHGHLDVVPAEKDDWQVDPFSGELTDDGYLWGRGAIDMKDMDAMLLALAGQWHADGTTPPRDIVLCFPADEEAGGTYGASYLVDHHPDLFEGCTEAVGEVGGFSVSLSAQQRLYAIQTAEKGMGWMRLLARGRPGHGSFLNDDNAVTALAEAVARLGRHEFPLVLTDTMKALLRELGTLLGIDLDTDDPAVLETAIGKLGAVSRIIGATLRNTANPTMLTAGYKANVIPQTAEATVDGRFLPGHDEEFTRQLREVIGPDIELEWLQHHIALETTYDGDLVAAMESALKAEDPGAVPVPYVLSGGTDAKHFARLGMRCFGFSPLRLPADLDFAALFHGIDERVPVDALKFGCRVLDRFVAAS